MEHSLNVLKIYAGWINMYIRMTYKSFIVIP